MSSSDDKFLRARITRRTDFAPDLWSIRVKPEGEFKFVPGQYATLGIDGPERRLERPFSMASSPHEEEIEFFLELVQDGKFSPPIFHLQRGDELWLRRSAKGRFVLDLASGRSNHLLVATVTGVAPFVSFARFLHHEWKQDRFKSEHTLFLIDGASRSWELGYCEELQEIAEEVPWLNYVPTVSRPWEDTNWRGEAGRVDDVLRKYVDLWKLQSSNTIAYLCGHPEMVEHSKGILTRIGFSKASLKEEVYWVPDKHKVA